MLLQPSSPRRRRLWLALSSLVLFLVLGLVGLYAWTRYASQRDLEEAIAETDKLDSYWRLEDLEAHRRPLPPPKENGFEQAMIAAALKPAYPWPNPKFPQFENDRAYQRRVVDAMNNRLKQKPDMLATLLCDEEARVLREELERAEAFIQEARKMADFPSGRGPSIVPAPGSVAVPAPSYISFLDLTKTLAPDVRVRLYDGDMLGALVDVRAMLNISHALEEEPSLMAQLVLRAMNHLTIETLQTVLASGTLPDKELADLQQKLEDQAAYSAVYNGMRGERAYFDRILERAQSGEISRKQLQAEFYDDFRGTSFAQRLSRRVQFMLLYGNLAGERAYTLRAKNELLAIGQLPPHERLKATLNVAARTQASTSPVSQWTGAHAGAYLYVKYFADELTIVSELWCAVAALAAERFRLANNRWPESLEELTPKYLKAVPIDPFSGQPLRFVRKDEALIVYSVGEKQRSDGGTVGPDGSVHRPDWGFVLHDVSRRRQPSPPFVFPEREPAGSPPSNASRSAAAPAGARN
jgi:hypothetical protein